MRKLKVSFLFLTCCQVIYAQESTHSAGSDASGSGGIVNYSIGQNVYTTHSGANGSVAQGVQQPYEIMVSVGIDVKEIQLELSVYPNPTTHHLNLRVENYTSKNYVYQLTDIDGKLIASSQIVENLSQISMEDLPVAAYFLTVKNGNQIIKNFKIIKN